MPDGLVDPHADLRTGVLRNLVGAGTRDGLRNAKGELVAMRTSEFLGDSPWGRRVCLVTCGVLIEACSGTRATGRGRSGPSRSARRARGRSSSRLPRTYRWASHGRAASWGRTTPSRAWPPGGFPAAWPTTMTTTASCTPFARVMVGHSAGSSRAGAAQSQDRARLLSDRSHREMGSRRATSIQSCKIGGVELPP